MERDNMALLTNYFQTSRNIPELTNITSSPRERQKNSVQITNGQPSPSNKTSHTPDYHI